MKEELLTAIPEINIIEDDDLKQKVINIWLKAIDFGNWSIADLHEMPFTLMDKPLPSIIQHTRAVTQIAHQSYNTVIETYKGKVTLNKDYIIAGAILHDVGKMSEYEKVDGRFQKSAHGASLKHTFSGVGFSFSEDLPYEIMHIIAVHSAEGDCLKRSPEAIIVWHADNTNADLF